MSVAPSTWEKLQQWVAGKTAIYGTVRSEVAQSVRLTDGKNYYRIVFYPHKFTEMTEYVPKTPEGRRLLLGETIELLIKGNILLIYDEESLPQVPDDSGSSGGIDERGDTSYAIGVKYNNTLSRLEAKNVQDALDELANRIQAGRAYCTNGSVIIDLTAHPYRPFKPGGTIIVTASASGVDANANCWVEAISANGFMLVVSDARYNGPVDWIAFRRKA